MAKDRMSDSEVERLARQINAAGLKKRWEEVAATSAKLAKTAPPGTKEHWLKASAEATKVVAILQIASNMETTANRAWREARAAESGAPRPVLRVIDGGADSEGSDEG